MIIYPPFLMIYLSFSSSFRSALLSFCPAFSPPASQTSPVSRLLFVVVSALLLVGFLLLFDVQDEVMHRVFLHEILTSLCALLPLMCILLPLLLHCIWQSLCCLLPFLFQLVPLSFHIPFHFLVTLLLLLKVKLSLFGKEYFRQ